MVDNLREHSENRGLGVVGETYDEALRPNCDKKSEKTPILSRCRRYITRSQGREEIHRGDRVRILSARVGGTTPHTAKYQKPVLLKRGYTGVA